MNLLNRFPNPLRAALTITVFVLSSGMIAFAQNAPRVTTAELMQQSHGDSLLAQASGQLAATRDLADTLHMYAEHPSTYDRAEFATQLNDLRVAINRAQEETRQLNSIMRQLRPLQVQVCSKIEKELNRQAELTEQSIQLFDRQSNPIRLGQTKFRENMEAIYKSANEAHRLVHNYLTFTKDSVKADRALRGVEKSSE